MRVMIIQGKVENIRDKEDFARMLGEKLGSDAELYFREVAKMRTESSPALINYVRLSPENVERIRDMLANGGYHRS